METEIRGEVVRLASLLTGPTSPARLMGGLAIWLTSETVRTPTFERPYGDLDLVARLKDRPAVQALLEAEGYAPDRRFNTMYGAQRLYYSAPGRAWTVDVIFDKLDMSHSLDLRERLGGPGATLPLADLLLSKLQIWEINRKDVADALCLLADHPISPSGEEVIDLGRITRVLGGDWGFGHTVERNLGRVAELAGEIQPAGTPYDPVGQVAALMDAIAAAPKSLAWKARARVGERLQWYDTPEEVEHPGPIQ